MGVVAISFPEDVCPKQVLLHPNPGGGMLTKCMSAGSWVKSTSSVASWYEMRVKTRQSRKRFDEDILYGTGSTSGVELLGEA